MHNLPNLSAQRTHRPRFGGARIFLITMLLCLPQAARLAYSADAAPAAVATPAVTASGPATAASAVPQPPAATDALSTKRAALADSIAKMTEQEEQIAAQAKTSGDTGRSAAVDELEEEKSLLDALDLLYLQHQATLEHRLELEQERKRLAEEADALKKFGMSEPRPYSFLLYEDIRDQLAAEEDRERAAESDLKGAEQMLEVARDGFAEAERARRQAREALDGQHKTDQQATLARDLRLAEINSTISQELVELRRAEITAKTTRHEVDQARRALLEAKAALVAKEVKFTQHDYDACLKGLARNRTEFERRLKKSERLLQQSETQQARTLAQLGQEKPDKSVLAAATAAFQLARHAHHEEIIQLNQRLRELDQLKHFLGCRFDMAGGKATHKDLQEWHGQLTEMLDELRQAEKSLSMRMDEIRGDQATLYHNTHVDNDADDPRKPWFDMQAEILSRLVDVCEMSLLHLKSGLRTHQRFCDDLEALTHDSAGTHWLATIQENCAAFWNYEIAAVDDRPITIGKIAAGFCYVLLGIGLARLISRLVGRHLLSRFGLNDGAINAVQSITFYTLCVTFSLLALEIVNLPFAAFTFLGGAVAIAFGFGSQNILNNFISGLILLAEQPVRVGDSIELDGERGLVEHIGARSTRVRTTSNHEIIVPNSRLLENKFTNLTLSDNLVRATIVVTLSPTLPVTDVRRRLLAAATAHLKVLTKPEPIVLFLDFSEKALSFELNFWIRLQSVMECRVVESEVRESISASLKETNAATITVTSVASVPAPATAPAMPETKPAADSLSLKRANEPGRELPALRKAG